MILETKVAAAAGAVVATSAAVVLAASVGAVSWIEDYNAIAASTGAIIIALAAVTGMLLTNRSNKKNREQVAQIAKDAAEALRLQNAAMIKQQEIAVKLDGRLEQLLTMNSEIAEALGVKKERKRAADEAAEKAAVTAVRDDKIIAVVAAKVANTVVDHVSDAIDEAVKTVPKET